MKISSGDEGGTTQAPKLGQAIAQTTRAAHKPVFSFEDLDLLDTKKSRKEITLEERKLIKKELTQTVTENDSKK